MTATGTPVTRYNVTVVTYQGARVTIDGKPATGTVALTAGEHAVTVTYPTGTADYWKDVTFDGASLVDYGGTYYIDVDDNGTLVAGVKPVTLDLESMATSVKIGGDTFNDGDKIPAGAEVTDVTLASGIGKWTAEGVDLKNTDKFKVADDGTLTGLDAYNNFKVTIETTLSDADVSDETDEQYLPNGTIEISVVLEKTAGFSGTAGDEKSLTASSTPSASISGNVTLDEGVKSATGTLEVAGGLTQDLDINITNWENA